MGETMPEGRGTFKARDDKNVGPVEFGIANRWRPRYAHPIVYQEATRVCDTAHGSRRSALGARKRYSILFRWHIRRGMPGGLGRSAVEIAPWPFYGGLNVDQEARRACGGVTASRLLSFSLLLLSLSCAESGNGQVTVSKAHLARDDLPLEAVALACRRVDVSSLGAQTLTQLRGQYAVLSSHLWARPPNVDRCLDSGLRLLAELDPDKGIDDLNRFVESYYNRIEHNNDAVFLRKAVVALGFAAARSHSASQKAKVERALRTYLYGTWIDPSKHRWADSLSESMALLVEREFAKGAVAGMLATGDRDLIRLVADLKEGSDHARRLPDYFVESYRAEAQRQLR